MPNALLFGPTLISTGLHLSGLANASLPPSLMAMVQVVFGVSVGVHIVSNSRAEVQHTHIMAILQALILLLIAMWRGMGIHTLTGVSLAAALLAYMLGFDWFNNRRLLESIGHVPPAERERTYYRQLEETGEAS